VRLILARLRGVAPYAAAAECDFIWRVMATAIGYYYIFPCGEYGSWLYEYDVSAVN